MPSRRTIAQVGRIGLVEARSKAKKWAEAAAKGIDPAEEESKAREAEAGRVTFGAAMEDYLKRHVSKTRKAKDAEREIRKELLSRWANRALADVTRKDVVKMVDELLDRGAEHQARNIFGHMRTFYNWAIARGVYDVEQKPCDRLRPKQLIGEKKSRQRVLEDAELRAFWAAAGRMEYPTALPSGCCCSLAAASPRSARRAGRRSTSAGRGPTIPPEDSRATRLMSCHSAPIRWRSSTTCRDGAGRLRLHQPRRPHPDRRLEQGEGASRRTHVRSART